MLYGKYDFTCELIRDALMPPYKGSMFRGAFGVALKRVVCALKLNECKDCLLRNRCLYCLVFETPMATQPPAGVRVSDTPHPFVIRPPVEENTHYPAGTGFTCSLLLFGEVNRKLPYFIYAFDRMGEIGIGKRIDGRRGAFVLREVHVDGKIVYECQSATLVQDQPIEDLLVTPAHGRLDGHTENRSEAAGDSSVTLTLETPLRLKFENSLTAQLPFHVLVRAVLRRISSLFQTYGQGEPELDYKGLVQRAAAVKTVDNRLRWLDWRRYSNRQEREMFMGGMTGEAVYRGKLGEYLPLLRLGERLHVGKQTTFGLGRIRVEVPG